MTSERPPFSLARGMLAILWMAAGGLLVACHGPQPAEPLEAPYEQRQVFAVAPLLNASGSGQADGIWMADHLTRQLETATPLSVVPVNRVLAAMQALEMPAVTDANQAQTLRRTLGVDGLIVGTITDYDPYDPPRLGLALDLYLSPAADEPDPYSPFDVRDVTRAPTDELSRPELPDRLPTGDAMAMGLAPASSVSGQFNASDPGLREQMQQYAVDRGQDSHSDAEWRLYRISIEHYAEFISYIISDKLLRAEALRLDGQQQTRQRPQTGSASQSPRNDREQPQDDPT